MVKFLFTAMVCVLGSAVHAEIPKPIIDECNVNQSGAYFNMPECLKGGAMGYDMLAILKQDEFYGSAVLPVIDGCRESNQSTETIWMCVRNAAKNAVETREMIGVENMQDVCYRAISNPEILSRIEDEYSEIRARLFGDDPWGGEMMYYQFKGCPEPEPDPVQTPEIPAQDGDSESALSAQACAALKEVDQALAGQTSEQLEALFIEVANLPEDERVYHLQSAGVTHAVLDFLESGNVDENRRALFIFAALLNKHHPDLTKKFMESQQTSDDERVSGMADVFLERILSMALEGYTEQCET